MLRKVFSCDIAHYVVVECAMKCPIKVLFCSCDKLFWMFVILDVCYFCCLKVYFCYKFLDG